MPRSTKRPQQSPLFAAAEDRHAGAATLPSATAFTDGSCDTASGHGGWAYLLDTPAGRLSDAGYEPGTTNNRMELTAAVRALEALTEPTALTIVTDSEYLKKAFTDWWLEKWQRNGWLTAARQSVKNRDLWEELLELERRHVVRWSWTKGHAGHAENEAVDAMALAARRGRGR